METKMLESARRAAREDDPYFCWICGLPNDLCVAMSWLDLMCTAATLGEVQNAQHAAWRLAEFLEDPDTMTPSI